MADSYSRLDFTIGKGGDVALKDFLLSLMNDPAKLAEFRNDPASTLEKSHLSQEEKDAVLSGDSARVQALIPGGGQGTPFNVVLMVNPGGPQPTRPPRPDTPPTRPPTPTRPPSPTTTPKPPRPDTPPKPTKKP